jgi:hypothetical protein
MRRHAQFMRAHSSAVEQALRAGKTRNLLKMTDEKLETPMSENPPHPARDGSIGQM